MSKSRTGLSKIEQETIITYNAEEKFAEVYTADIYIMQKLDKLCKKYPEHYELVSENDYSKNYKIATKKLVAFRPPVILTDEQKKEMAKRLQDNVNKKR